MEKKEKKEEKKKISELPVKEIKYNQSVEEMKLLIPFLKDEMKSCPSEDVEFIFTELIDYYGLKRNFKIKSQSPINNVQPFNQFKDNFLTNLSFLETFTVIPNIDSFELIRPSDKGKKFQEPILYNINGDETRINNFGGKPTFLFLFDHLADLDLFIMANKNINIMVYCLCINMNFFETKTWIKNNGLLNSQLFNICFTENESLDTSTNLKLTNLPRIAIIGPDGVIQEDRCIKNINSFNLQRDLINMEQKELNRDELEKLNKFINLENENKRKVVKSMNIYLKEKGIKGVHFYVKSKISIDKKGIKKIRCYPVFYGEATKDQKNMIDNLISSLNAQELFHEIQCKVKYN